MERDRDQYIYRIWHKPTQKWFNGGGKTSVWFNLTSAKKVVVGIYPGDYEIIKYKLLEVEG